jgi:hypothetical protein
MMDRQFSRWYQQFYSESEGYTAFAWLVFLSFRYYRHFLYRLGEELGIWRV